MSSNREPPPIPPPGPLPVLLAAIMVLGVIVAGGGRHQIVQAIAFGGIGALLVFAPFRRMPNTGLLVACALLMVVACGAFLPQNWFLSAPWRTQVTLAGVELGSTHSPQPELSFEAVMFMGCVLAWMLWLVNQEWNPFLRERAMKVLAVGMIAIAALALVVWSNGWKIPGWLDTQLAFGPFKNRNHTAHVFAIGALLALGCAGNAMRWKIKFGLPWVGGALLIVAALVVGYSRGGIIMFFGALMFWAGLAAWKKRSWQVLGLGFSGMMALCAVILLKGGPIVQRFIGQADSDLSFRAKIWRDALTLANTSPWAGIGLGNFKAVFPFFRNVSLTDYGVWHPESDWLQAATEMGWFSVILLLVIFGLIMRRIFPFRSGTQRRLRGAALAAAVGAAGHGLVDVPGHRLGCILLSIFVFALARRDPVRSAGNPLATGLSRAMGIAVLGFAFWWGSLTDYAAMSERHLLAGQNAEVIDSTTKAIQRAPMDWISYYNRAQALALNQQILPAIKDFRKARALEPNAVKLPLEEGAFWIYREPELAFPAWLDALRRAPEDQLQHMFGNMMSRYNTPDFRERMLGLAEGQPALLVAWFNNAPEDEAIVRLPKYEEESVSWNRVYREALAKRADSIREKTGPRPTFRGQL